MTTEKPHILVIDDDDRLRSLLGKYLSENGFLVSYAADAGEARKKMSAFLFDLLVLDVMMPSETGLSFLASIDKNKTPTLMLSAMGEAEDRVKGLELGAEDYLIKPFEPKELLLRIRAILRRTMEHEEKNQAVQIVQFGDFKFDLDAMQLTNGGEIVSLTSNEAAMLKFLAQQAGNPVSREDLAKIMPSAAGERSVDVQMSRLRKKLQADEKDEKHDKSQNKQLYLQTIRGAGYVLYAKSDLKEK